MLDSDEAFFAFRNGKSIKDNTYPPGTEDHDWWDFDFKEAEYYHKEIDF